MVDLVGEDDMGEDGPLEELEPAPFGLGLLDDLGPGDIRGHQVGGKLNAAEGKVQDLGQGFDDQGLGQPGDAYQEHVTPAEHGQEQVLQDLLLADDDVPDFPKELLAGGVELIDELQVIHSKVRIGEG